MRPTHFVTAPVSSVVGAGLASVMHALGRARRTSRPLHPRGRVVRGVLHRHGLVPPVGVPWLDTEASDDVVVRTSRSVGLPRPLPDVAGLAIRWGADSDHPGDLLFSSTGSGPLTRFLLLPTRSDDGPMTTLMPFNTPAGPVVVAAQRSGPDSFELRCAVGTGTWRTFAHLALDPAADGDDDAGLRFDPVLNELPGLPAYDWARRLRQPSYRAARTTRTAGEGRGGAATPDVP